MAIESPGCCDTEWQLLYKILASLPDINTGGGGGSAIAVLDEGVLLTAGVTSFNFTGSGITATAVGTLVTVNVPVGTGDVVGPAVSVNNDIAAFNGVTGKLIKDSGVDVTTVVVGPALAVLNNIATYNGITGKIIKDSGINVASVVTNSTLQSGSEAIGSGVDTISVVFPTAFGVIPNVVVSISRPVAENMIEVNIDEASISGAGFTCSLGAATGSANYKLKWMAK